MRIDLSIFTLEELVAVYIDHRRGIVILTNEQEMRLLEELLEREPSGLAAWKLLKNLHETDDDIGTR